MEAEPWVMETRVVGPANPFSISYPGFSDFLCQLSPLPASFMSNSQTHTPQTESLWQSQEQFIFKSL